MRLSALRASPFPLRQAETLVENGHLQVCWCERVRMRLISSSCCRTGRTNCP